MEQTHPFLSSPAWLSKKSQVLFWAPTLIPAMTLYQTLNLLGVSVYYGPKGEKASCRLRSWPASGSKGRGEGKNTG